MRDVQCKRCLEYKGNWCDKKRDDPDTDLVRDCEHYRTKTNADRIRTMTDEELAMMIYEVSWRIAQDPDHIDTEQDWLDWLKQEVNNG